jgi:ATP-binding cassette subfamily B protein
MASDSVPTGGPRPQRLSTRKQLQLLIGDKRRPVLALAIVSIVAAFIESAVLAIIAQVAAVLATGAKVVHVTAGPIHVHASVPTLLGVGLALTLARLLLQWPLAVLPARIASQVGATLRHRVFASFVGASWGTQASDREGQLQEIMTNQTGQALSGALQATGLITSGLTFVILLASAVIFSLSAAGIVLVIAVVMFGILQPLRSLGARYARSASAAQVEFAAGVAEANRLAEETHVFGVAEAQEKRVGVLIDACRNLLFRAQVVVKLVPSLYMSLILIVLMLGLDALYKAGEHHAGSLGAVILLLLRASQNGLQVATAYQLLQQSLPFIERLEDSHRRYSASAPVEGSEPLASVQSITFDAVSFSYRPGDPVLHEVSFQVESGEAIGIIGPSGAGKSTLVQILLQLRWPESGRFLVNGQPVEQYSRDDWRRLVAYIPQEPRLLHASVADNIRFFRELSDEEVERAGRLARIHDDIVDWPNGYETIVGPRADAVSGGQQQRICLARALVARPAVVVLDEPTSALDPHSETLIQESLTALRSELTLFTIAHRMSTLDMCDRVMVVLGGRLVAFDTRAALQQDNDYYRRASTIAAGTRAGSLQ